MTPAGSRRGFAAPLALCMLAALAGLAAGAFHSIVQARRAADRSWREQQATALADRALGAAIHSWNVPAYDSLPVGGMHSVEHPGDSVERSGARSVVMRVTERLFWVATVGRAAVGTPVAAQRLQQLVVEVLRPAMPRVALTSRGDLRVGPEAEIQPEDRAPPGWADCPSPDTAVGPAVLLPDGGRVSGGGTPPIVATDPAAGDPSTYDRLGRVPVSALAERAQVEIAAGAILSPLPDLAGGCRSGVFALVGSWGEPLRSGGREACERYFPVVVARGDLVVTGGRGQGVLIVNGRLRIRGPFLFAGLILAKGGVELSDAGAEVYGAVLSADPAGVDWLGGALRRSSCALWRAGDAAARPYPVALRGWAEVH